MGRSIGIITGVTSSGRPEKLQITMASTLKRNKDRIGKMADAVESIGTAYLWSRLTELLAGEVAFDQAALFRYVDHLPPERIFDAQPGPERDRLHLTLLRAAYPISPYINKVIWAGGADDFYHIRDVAPDEFAGSEYYRVYYSEKHVEDEGLFFTRIDRSLSIGLVVERQLPSTPFSKMELAMLHKLAPLVSALIRQHSQGAKSESTTADNAGSNRISERMTGAFMRFGSKVLTEREREIAGLILRGHSSKAAARELNIAPETERVHRKRLYAKLGISSHADLFWMFIESFSYFDPESTDDPLQEYLRLRRVQAS